MTSKDTLRYWFDRGIDEGATHMIVVCDTYDHSDYPVYVDANQNVRDVEKDQRGNMRQVMEVYDLRMSCEDQMAERRAFHY